MRSYCENYNTDISSQVPTNLSLPIQHIQWIANVYIFNDKKL